MITDRACFILPIHPIQHLPRRGPSTGSTVFRSAAPNDRKSVWQTEDLTPHSSRNTFPKTSILQTRYGVGQRTLMCWLSSLSSSHSRSVTIQTSIVGPLHVEW